MVFCCQLGLSAVWFSWFCVVLASLLQPFASFWQKSAAFVAVYRGYVGKEHPSPAVWGVMSKGMSKKRTLLQPFVFFGVVLSF